MQTSIFEVIGPVMIGPSSSHTAGAQKLGRAAYLLAGHDIQKIHFHLHGSFAQTYKGHGTDKALVGGALGMQSWDENIRDSHQIAAARGLEFSFSQDDLGEVHPNTVAMDITKSDGTTLFLQGSSVGGGNVVVHNINGMQCEITGHYQTIVISHQDKIGMIHHITYLLSAREINIVSIKNNRSSPGEQAFTIIETDEPIPDNFKERMLEIAHVYAVEIIEKF